MSFSGFIGSRLRLPAYAFRAVISFSLGALVLIAFRQVVTNDFITCDDPDYVVNNLRVQNGFSVSSLKWAFTTSHANNWHPLTWLSHMLDCATYGLKPAGHHLTNLLLHCINTLLIFTLFSRLTEATWRSAFVAALFGLHPMHVESVAWVAERKDVLSTFFFLLTLWAYARYVQCRMQSAECRVTPPRAESRASSARKSAATPSTLDPRPSTVFYALSLAFFACGLMSKPMVVTLPFVLVLLDFWPLGRFGFSKTGSRPKAAGYGRVLLEKVPFLVLSGIVCVITVLVQSKQGNMATLDALPVGVRFSNACVSYIRYLTKLFWPTGLAVHYPYDAGLSWQLIGLAFLTIVALSAGTTALMKSRPYLFVGWFWFLGTLIPVIGLIQVGMQAMADRYSYIPFIGIFAALSWAIGDLAAKRPPMFPAVGTAAVAIVMLFFVLSVRQVSFWRNTETLFGHALSVTANNAPAHVNLGTALVMKGDYDRAELHFSQALTIRPDYPEALSNVGFIMATRGRYLDAIDLYQRCLRTRPSLAQTHYLLASAFRAIGDLDGAIRQYRTCITLNPEHPLALNDLAWILATDPAESMRNGGEAVQLAQRACEVMNFTQAQLIGTLAAAYAEAGRFDAAIQTAERAKAVAEKTGQADLAARNEQLLELYRAHKPFRENHG